MKIEKYKNELRRYLDWFKTIMEKYPAKTRREFLMKVDDADMQKIMAWCKELNDMTVGLGLDIEQIMVIDESLSRQIS